MTENRIQAVRRYCVSIMVLCLVFLGVYIVQEKTGSQTANAGENTVDSTEQGTDWQEIQNPENSFSGVWHMDTKIENSAWSKVFGTGLPESVKQQGDNCILIKKSEGAVIEDITDEMVYRRVTVTVNGSLYADDIYRLVGESLFIGTPDRQMVVIPEEQKNVPLQREPKVPEEDLLLSATLSEKDGKTRAVLELNSVYEIAVNEDEEFIYLSLIRPHEKYDKIIVIDPGHGGIDPGTSGGGFTEASINLKVARYLKELLDERQEWKVYYTRLDNSLPDLSTRVEFANALHADMLISVHCNYNPASVMNGVEVLYSAVQGTEDTFNSRYLAELCSAFVAEKTGLKERPLVERSKNLHITKYCTMPMALIEFGFMSNRNDLSIISTEKAQRECAEAIYRAIEASYEALEKGEKR